MPNVEICGYPMGSDSGTWRLKGKITGILIEAGFGDTAVVTVAQSVTEDCKWMPAPYLRIWSSDPTGQEAVRIDNALKAAGIDMDVEAPPPIRFKKKGESLEPAKIYDPAQEELGG